jgi:hypothetical protein
MKAQEKQEIMKRAQEWMRSSLISNHLSNTKKLTKLSEFKINPFLWPYLANYYRGTTDYRALAEVLILPRVLGTSITTTFGNEAQRFISTVFSDSSYGSVVSGIDIEFIDAVDGRKKYCQLKAGPNGLNKDDVKTVTDHFQAVKNLARTNSLPLQHNDMVLGILYGEPEEMNGNIKAVAKEYPLYAGKEFWFRFTGDEDFYEDLAVSMADVAEEVDVREVIEQTIDALAQEIIQKYPDISKTKKL